jgi:oligopeptide/dipeptide ABC transporter ATP-binding protein
VSGPLLRVEAVTKRFGPKVAVDQVDFEVERGRTLGLVGESGSGKSTVARLVVGLERADSGTISFDGRALPTGYAELRPVRQRMGMVFQSPVEALDPHLPLLDLVVEPLRAAGRRADATAGTARHLLDQVGLGGADLGHRAAAFSGGEQQRIAFARALALGPELIICDEPTSSLDVSVQAQILNLMLELQARSGVSFLLISHDLDVIRRMSDQVVVLLDGQVMERGDAEAVATDPAHPYTRALLAAVPRPRWAAGQGDEPPHIARVPAGGGCPFASRCPLVHDRCAERPALRDRGGRAVACHLVDDPKGGPS